MNLLFKEINMLSGLEIVLARIKEYPEELPKWANLVENYKEHFTQEEAQAWLDMKIQVGRERFNERVLKHLSGEEDVLGQVDRFQNEVSRMVASKQQNIMKQATTEMYGSIISERQLVNNPSYANNYR